MCGIAGIVNLTSEAPVEPERLSEAVAALAHRGPDGAGMFVRPHVALGATRLAIVDLEHGHQPMQNEDGTVTVVYNGEIYNHAELRAELTALGHHFHTRADTEVLPHGYEEWGPEGLLGRLRGMFAFAIWDQNRRRLFLARDRMGMKPLYYVELEGRLYFASEIRPLLLASRMDRRMNRDAFTLFMRLGFTPAPHTMFRGLRKLHAAHFMLASARSTTIRCYWKLSYAPRLVMSERGVVEDFRKRLSSVIDLHRMSDVPIGALLSGGVDSGTIATFLHRLAGRDFLALTVGFAEQDYDEAARATECARGLGVNHELIHFDDSSLDELPKMVEAYEEPSARSTFTALYYLFRASRQRGLKVVLTGEGADELLGGYAWHWRSVLPGGLWSRRPELLRAASLRGGLLAAVVDGCRQAEQGLRVGARMLVRRYVEAIQIGKPERARRLLHRDIGAELDGGNFDDLLSSWVDYATEARSFDPFQRLLWLQSRTRLADYINHNLDRMSMAHSVEARPPFLDHLLWQFCAPLPRRLKVRGYYPHQTEKYLLREAGSGLVPDCVRVAAKSPLRVPYLEWLGRARLPEWAEDALSAAELNATGLFDAADVASLREEARVDPANKGTLLMAVLTMQLWLRIFRCQVA